METIELRTDSPEQEEGESQDTLLYVSVKHSPTFLK